MLCLDWSSSISWCHPCCPLHILVDAQERESDEAYLLCGQSIFTGEGGRAVLHNYQTLHVTDIIWGGLLRIILVLVKDDAVPRRWPWVPGIRYGECSWHYGLLGKLCIGCCAYPPALHYGILLTAALGNLSLRLRERNDPTNYKKTSCYLLISFRIFFQIGLIMKHPSYHLNLRLNIIYFDLYLIFIINLSAKKFYPTSIFV